MTILRAHNLGKSYTTYPSEFYRICRWFGFNVQHGNECWILKNINLEIQSGESVGIVGKNGAGKSTLLKLLTGTINATEGTIEIRAKVSAILELGIGFNSEFTGRENAYHSLGLMGYSTEQINNAIDDIRDFSEVNEYFDMPMSSYSSGMQMRVAFSVATIFKPGILIVDEALSVGDAYFQAKCYKRIAELKKLGTSLLLVSHNINDIINHCDRALLLSSGKVTGEGHPKDISNLYFDEVFGNLPSHKLSPSEEIIDDPAFSQTHANKSIEDIFHNQPGYNKNEHRWGNQKVQILDYSITSEGQRFPHQIISGSLTNFHFKVIVKDEVKNLVPGILIKTVDGMILYGSNSIVASYGKEMISAAIGEVKIFTFSLPLSLNEGDYLVSFGISEGSNLEDLIPLDRRYDSVLLHVLSSKKHVGVIDLNASFEQAQT